MLEVNDNYYFEVCDRIGLERVDEGHQSDDDNDSWHLVSINNNPSVNGDDKKTDIEEDHMDLNPRPFTSGAHFKSFDV